MAKKFGKREKLVVGFIALIGAIAAVHFLVFQQPAKSLAETEKEFRDSEEKARRINAEMPARPKIDEFDNRTFSFEKTLWNTVLDLNLVPSPDLLVFYKRPDIAKPAENADEKEKQRLKGLEKVNVVRIKAHQAAAEAIITARLEGLIAMKKAYEAGAPWSGDDVLTSLPKGVAKPAPIKLPMKLSFADNKDDGWRLPIELKKELKDKPALWDEVRRLHDTWAILNFLPLTNVLYPEKYQAFLTQMEKVGMPTVYQIHAIRTGIGKEIPAFNNVLMARRIWEQIPTQGSKPTVGQNDPITPKLLQRIFIVDIPGLSTKMPRYNSLGTFNQQLIMLERLLPLARKSGVEEVSIVRLPATGNIVEQVIKKIDPNAAPTGGMFGFPGMMRPGMPGMMRPGVPGMMRPGMPGMMRPGMPGMPPGMMQGRGLVSLKAEERLEIESRGQAALVELTFTAANQNAVRFLYDVVTDPKYFRIEGIQISSVEKQEKIKVTVTVESLLRVNEVSALFGPMAMMNPVTGYPQDQLDDLSKKPPLPGKTPRVEPGRELWMAKLAQAGKTGVDVQKIIQECFEQAGYSTKVPYVDPKREVNMDEKDPTLEDLPPTPEPTPTPVPMPAAMPEPAAPDKKDEGGGKAKLALPSID